MPLSESELTDEKILSRLQAVMQMISISLHENEGTADTLQGVDPEYACLRSMMLEPQNPTLWNALTLVYMMTARYEDARNSIERSLDLDTGIAWTWSIWGDLLFLMGDELEAERAYRMAVELGSDEPHVFRQLVQYSMRRENYHEALSLLEMLIPLYPEDQMLWDIYTECLQYTHQSAYAWSRVCSNQRNWHGQ
jgi:tetratricopeptide (TPR) repeat protein